MSAGSLTIYSTLNVDPTTGAITVSGASTITIPSSNSTPPTCINSYYIDGGIYYKFTSAMTWTSVYSTGYFTTYRAKITTSKMPITHLEEIFSNVQTAYPVNAIQDNYWYIYKGSDPNYNSHYAKLLDVTTNADAAQVELDLSGIDLSPFVKLELIALPKINSTDEDAQIFVKLNGGISCMNRPSFSGSTTNWYDYAACFYAGTCTDYLGS